MNECAGESYYTWGKPARKENTINERTEVNGLYDLCGYGDIDISQKHYQIFIITGHCFVALKLTRMHLLV